MPIILTALQNPSVTHIILLKITNSQHSEIVDWLYQEITMKHQERLAWYTHFRENDSFVSEKYISL